MQGDFLGGLTCYFWEQTDDFNFSSQVEKSKDFSSDRGVGWLEGNVDASNDPLNESLNCSLF